MLFAHAVASQGLSLSSSLEREREWQCIDMALTTTLRLLKSCQLCNSASLWRIRYIDYEGSASNFDSLHTFARTSVAVRFTKLSAVHLLSHPHSGVIASPTIQNRMQCHLPSSTTEDPPGRPAVARARRRHRFLQLHAGPTCAETNKNHLRHSDAPHRKASAT